MTPPRKPWYWLLSKRWRDYAAMERTALPDGTRVRLVCNCQGFSTHEGVWVTSWTPRRMGDIDGPNDYRLTREGDGDTTYATRGALEVVR